MPVEHSQRGEEYFAPKNFERRKRRQVKQERWLEEAGASIVWQTVRTVAGLTLVALGVIGMLLPIIPGIPLLIAGVALLGTNHPWVRPVVVRLRLWRRKRTRAAGTGQPDRSDRRDGGVPGR